MQLLVNASEVAIQSYDPKWNLEFSKIERLHIESAIVWMFLYYIWVAAEYKLKSHLSLLAVEQPGCKSQGCSALSCAVSDNWFFPALFIFEKQDTSIRKNLYLPNSDVSSEKKTF